MAAEGERYRPAFPPSLKPYISTGLPFQKACAHHVTNTFNASKIYLIVSSSISKTQNFRSLESELGDKIVAIRYGIKPHTPWTDVLEIVNDIKDKGADLLITLGAGSLTDGAKIVTFALANKAFTLDQLAKLDADEETPNLLPCQLPTINIPTSLSGGEYSPAGGATDMRTHRKSRFTHPSMGADLVILDPALSVSTPELIWLSTGMRAVDHCVEGLCSTSPAVGEASDLAFTEGLKLLVPNLLRTRNDWANSESRLNEMMGVLEAMKGVKLNIPMGASHGIGHQLGPLGVGHGETSCVMLPHVLKYNHLNGNEAVKQAQKKVVEIFWKEPTIAKMLKARGLNLEADAGDLIGALVSELGMPRTLKDVRVTRDKLDSLAENSMKDSCIPTNPVTITKKAQVMDILLMAMGDDDPSI